MRPFFPLDLPAENPQRFYRGICSSKYVPNHADFGVEFLPIFLQNLKIFFFFFLKKNLQFFIADFDIPIEINMKKIRSLFTS